MTTSIFTPSSTAQASTSPTAAGATLTQDATFTQEEAALLNDLLQMNLDSQNGYETAAEALENQEYAIRFRQFAQERKENADELTHLLRTHGHQASKSGTLSGLFHQGWLNLEALLASGDGVLLAECERVDALILAAYQNVMGKPGDAEVTKLLRRQFTVIRDARNYNKNLHDALQQASR
jgi:uncharacterized protein (TIGR02284 family)